MAGNTLRDLTHKWLDYGIHAIEFFIAVTILLFAGVLSGHLLVVLWQVVQHFGPNTTLHVRSAVMEAMNLLIMLELAQVFIRLEAKQQLGVTLLLDTAILFSIRESIVSMYGNSHHLVASETAAAVFVVLRIIHSWKRPKDGPHSSKTAPKDIG